jgi:hypothetical protein
MGKTRPIFLREPIQLNYTQRCLKEDEFYFGEHLKMKHRLLKRNEANRDFTPIDPAIARVKN